MTRGLSVVYPRFISGMRSALCSGCRPAERRLFVPTNPFHARHVREKRCKACPGMHFMKKKYSDNESSVHWSAARKQVAPVVPVVNRSSTGYRDPLFGLRKNSFALASEESIRTAAFDDLELWAEKGSIASWANRPVGGPSCPIPLSLATSLRAAPTRPAHVMSEFWIRQIRKSTQVGRQLHR